MVSIFQLAANNVNSWKSRQQSPFWGGIVNYLTIGLLWKHCFHILCVFDFQMNDIIRLISEFQQSKYGKVLYWKLIDINSVNVRDRIFLTWFKLLNVNFTLIELSDWIKCKQHCVIYRWFHSAHVKLTFLAFFS